MINKGADSPFVLFSRVSHVRGGATSDINSPQHRIIMKLNLLLFLATLSSLFVKTSGTATFELNLEYFKNDKGVNKDGNCCNGIRTNGQCQSKCRTFFSVCLTHFIAKINNANPECTFGRQDTPAVGENSINFFEDSLPDFHNPFKFPITVRWPGTFTLIVEAWHDQTLTGPKKGSPRELIMRWALPASVRVQQTWTNDTHTTGSSSLKVGYRVVCDANYYGEGCSEICRPREDNFGHYTCSNNGSKVCLPGWKGPTCEEAICLPGCDTQKGYCDQPSECKCKPGWQGKLCNECIPLPGCQQGVCKDEPWTCICKEGWGGLYCNQDLNYCTNKKPCRNGARCENTGEGSYTCICPPGYSGSNCEIITSRCNEQGCQNGGTCKHNGQKYVCECPKGFHGSLCESSASSCEENPCKNGGSCQPQPHGYSCLCPAGFTGVDCEQQVNECASSPCLNGAKCEDLLNGFRCICGTGFEGKRCEINTNDCKQNPCKHGRCKDLTNGFKCLCYPGYTGRYCHREVNECHMSPCANGGTCHDGVNDFTCDCAPGFTGKHCDTNINECDSSPCHNGANCEDHVNYFECKCMPGFYGVYCEYGDNSMSSSQNNNVVGSSKATTLSPVGPNDPYGVRADPEPTRPPDSASVTMQQLLLIICLGVGIPIVIIIAIIIFLLCTRRQDREPDVLKDNARNERSSMNNKDKTKCIDANVISTIPPNTNVCLKLTNEQQDSHRAHRSKQHLNSNLDRSLLQKNHTNIKDINTVHSLSSQKDYDRRKKKTNMDNHKRLEDGSSSFESFADPSDISTSIQVVKPINKEPNSKSLLFIEKQHRHPCRQEGMLATEV